MAVVKIANFKIYFSGFFGKTLPNGWDFYSTINVSKNQKDRIVGYGLGVAKKTIIIYAD